MCGQDFLQKKTRRSLDYLLIVCVGGGRGDSVKLCEINQRDIMRR